MKSCEPYIDSRSNYYIYAPSVTARETFFYPICVGNFIYESGYQQKRDSYDSFLLMYIKSGSLTIETEGRTQDVFADHFILLDCYCPHGYWSETGWEALWFHFDGPMARAYYSLIHEHLGNAFSLQDSYPLQSKMEQICHTFAANEPVREAFISKQISDILTAMILYQPEEYNGTTHSGIIEESTSYISEHFCEVLSVDSLASKAMLSTYHYIRVFKKETGYTPHEYIIRTRIGTAKYMLKTTRLPIKDICYNTGFSSESVFCTAFKKHVGLTPAEYRNHSC